MEFENVRPEEIEKRSFEIITKELAEAGISIDEKTAFVTKRCIHA